MPGIAESALKAWRKAPLGRSSVDGRVVAKDEKMVLVASRYERWPGDVRLTIVAYPKPTHFDIFRKAEPTPGFLGGGLQRSYPGSVGGLSFKVHRWNDCEDFPSGPVRIIPATYAPDLKDVVFNFDFSQTSFKVDTTKKPEKKPPEFSWLQRLRGKDKTAFLSLHKAKYGGSEYRVHPTLHKHYAGWLKRAVDLAFVLASEQDADLVFKKYVDYSSPGRRYQFKCPAIIPDEVKFSKTRVVDDRESELEAAIRLAVKKHGASVIQNDSNYLIVRVQKCPPAASV